jgi:hypothetical protein
MTQIAVPLPYLYLGAQVALLTKLGESPQIFAHRIVQRPNQSLVLLQINGFCFRSFGVGAQRGFGTTHSGFGFGYLLWS